MSILMKNHKTKNISDTLDIPFENSKHHLDNFLMFIWLFGGGYITCPFIVQKLHVQTCQVCQNIKIVKLFGNHSYYFLKWSHDDQQAMTLVGLI